MEVGGVTQTDHGRQLTAAQAAERLGVKRATLYAYVSRGLLHSERQEGRRGSLFNAAEVERLASRGNGGPPSDGSTLVIRSALTMIEDERLFYRGEDALAIARERQFEEVAEFLWTGEWPESIEWSARAETVRLGRAVQAPLPSTVPPFDRLRLVAAAIPAAEPLRFDTRPGPALVTSRALMAALVECLPERRPPAGDSMAWRLWPRLTDAKPTPDLVAVLNAAMILLADHELSASTLAARVAASVRADPYSVVLTGYGTLAGALHGAASLAAESMLAEMDGPRDAPRVVSERARRGEHIPGFGHFVYRTGDPRAGALFDLLQVAVPDAPALACANEVMAMMRANGQPLPNVDFALAAFTRAAGMPIGAGQAIFAIARSAGWLAHAIEEYTSRSRIRPRAVYVGLRPTRQ